ncbi:hypothetical protein SLH49_17520 [Cognatiyoonia sp. IB215446]|uniref:hypothetical protein n=1 Tax=Cognatiyoonia sp. IB215446 TaxID=3097355 RepID=UPI002A16D6EE|nr:hypothetical protein [Cognatiyoonia sp. IB215446]MDX8349788.1 hypothetical protein [Cognatiyoonia sp. IB215446]
MADEYLERVAGELADLALADERRSADNRIVDEIGEIVGASSQTLQEAFLTAVRVRRAETRARQLLAERAAEQMNKATPLISQDEAADAEVVDEPSEAPAPAQQSDSETEAVMEEIDNLIKPTRPGRR